MPPRGPITPTTIPTLNPVEDITRRLTAPPPIGLTAAGAAAEPITTTAPESPDATATEELLPESETRIFERALGTAEIPAHPERVAVLNIAALDSARLTDITPIATARARKSPRRTDDEQIAHQPRWGNRCRGTPPDQPGSQPRRGLPGRTLLSTVLSLPFLVDRVMPTIEAGMNHDPETESTK